MSEKTCPTCQGRGLYIKDNQTACICPCTRQTRIENLARASHMTDELRKKSFATFNLSYYSRQEKDPDRNKTHYEIAAGALEVCRGFVRDMLHGKRPRGLYIHGRVGSGKTHLACSIANELVKKGMEALFVVVPDYLEEIKHSWEKDSTHHEKEILDRAREVEVLIMDDLGSHSYSNWTKNKIYSMLNHRNNHNLPTVITSNLDFWELENYLEQRISSRITELCKPVLLLVDKEEDIRLKKLAEVLSRERTPKR